MRMPSPILICLFSFAACVSAANIPRVPQREPRPGNAFYTIYPEPGADTSQAVDFIKSVVDAEDLLPWTDAHENLISWTVEASPEEVDQIQGHDGISRVTELAVPSASASNTSATANQEPESISDGDGLVPRQEQEATAAGYMIIPKDPENDGELAATENALKELLDEVEPVKLDDEFLWWYSYLLDSQVEEAGNVPGVASVDFDHDLEPDYIAPPSPSSPLHDKRELYDHGKRDLGYSSQPNAAKELRMISQPSTIPDLSKLKDYVYETDAGEDGFIYHIERGVDLENNRNVSLSILERGKARISKRCARRGPHADPKSKGEYQRPTLDYSPIHHGACTASKAVGSKYGVSKKAKLIVVQMNQPTESELDVALRLVARDVSQKHPDRAGKSVVTISLSASEWNSATIERVRRTFLLLKRHRVPIVVTAGNDGEKEGRKEIDRYPALIARQGVPLIVVGANDDQGREAAFSQNGPLVTTHAMGVDVTCITKTGQPRKVEGTSVSAPQVAAQIVNWLRSDFLPIDPTDDGVVEDIRDHLNSDKGGWARVDGVRVPWNGVTEEHHQQATEAGDQGGDGEGELSCADLGVQKYVARDHLKDAVEKFCPDAESQGALDENSGSITRKYYEGTQEEVTIAMDFDPGSDFKPQKNGCVKGLMRTVDGCSVPEDGNNPNNVKAGGTNTAGPVKYRIEPAKKRQPADKAFMGGCDCRYKGLFNECWIWGHGWVSHDNGKGLQDQVNDCALLPKTWNFDYGLGDDGREWTAKFRTGVFQKKCTKNAGREAGGPKDLKCSGFG